VIPLLHDFTGETVLVVGGGPVGARKARRFAREASVVVLSPEFADREFGGAERVRAAPEPDAMADWVARIDPALVVAATDDEAVNDAAVAAARDHGAMVNHADQHGERAVDNVAVPATVRDGPVTVALATGGQAPALSKYLRERIEAEFTELGGMAELTAELRETLKTSGLTPTDRREALRSVVRSEAVWKALDTPDTKADQVAADVIQNVTGERP